MPGNLDELVWLGDGTATVTLQDDVHGLLTELGAGNIELGIELACEDGHGNKA
jgi:hypothetical protein